MEEDFAAFLSEVEALPTEQEPARQAPKKRAREEIVAASAPNVSIGNKRQKVETAVAASLPKYTAAARPEPTKQAAGPKRMASSTVVQRAPAQDQSSNGGSGRHGNGTVSKQEKSGAQEEHHRKKSAVRTMGGKTWKDKTLEEWPENDFRLFVGHLDKCATNKDLSAAFQKYKSFAMARVVCDKYKNKSRGYGFVSFLDPFECAKALKEMNRRLVCGRPITLKVDNSHKMDPKFVRKREQKKKNLWKRLR